MSHTEHATDPFDPFSQWQAMRDRTMEAWSKMMLDFVHSDAYATASAKWLDSYLTLSQSFQGVVDQAMTQTMSQYKIPSTEDFNRLAERIWNIELKLDDLDARLGEMFGLLKTFAAKQPTPAPVRPEPVPVAKEERKPAARPTKAPQPVAKATPAPRPAAPVPPAVKPAAAAAPTVKATPAAPSVAKVGEPARAGNGVTAPHVAPAKTGGLAAAAHSAPTEEKSKAPEGKPSAADISPKPEGKENK